MLPIAVLITIGLAGLARAAPGSWSDWHVASSHYSPTPTQTPQSSNTATITSSASTKASSVSSTTTVTSLGACGSVSSLSASLKSASPSAVATVPAQLAYECLTSIPFNQSAAEQYLDSIDPYITWQTTLQYVRDPPAAYAANVQQPYDFYATWDAIKANTSAGAYKSEYEFGWTVYRAAQLVHDGHFVFYPDSVTEIFSFARRSPLVSVSLDGKTPPQPYVYADILAASKSTASFTPSPIVKIDGQDAIQYLLVWSEYGSLQDPDALWNNLFYEPAQVALGSSGTGTGTFNGGGRGRWPYPGPTTTLSFANGSSLTYENYARVLQPFDGINTGEDVYQAFLVPPPEAYQNAFEYASSSLTSTSTSSAPASTTPTPTPTNTPTPGYPTPFVQETANLNAGYFIDAPGYEDVAVLVVRSFVGTLEDEIPFQAVNTYFIETAAAMGKTKLIIDVSANGGGTILQGYDLFKQLFPSVLPYGATRFNAHEAFNLLGEQTSYLVEDIPRSLNNSPVVQDLQSSAFDYQTDADVNYEPFTSWQEKYGPVALGPDPDNYTSIIRWNLSDVLTPLNSGGIYVSGYLNRTNITAQPFAAENIIILTDGYCASTCTIFAELMTTQGGVKTVALGGRPSIGDSIIQAIGGVKGTNDFPFDYIFEYTAEVFGASNASTQAQWKSTVLADYTALPLYRSAAVVVNARNGYLPGDNTPLQFVYQPADCRVLYTPAMVVDETAVWKTVADSVWGGGAGNACVAGGFGSGTKRDVTESLQGRAGDVQMHSVREGVDYEAILGSFEVQTEMLTMVDGDSVMIP